MNLAQGKQWRAWEQTENKFTLEERGGIEHCEEKQGRMETRGGVKSFYFRQGFR